MEIGVSKTVVVGIGGAGCKIVRQLSGATQGNCELVALDKDGRELDSLAGNVTKFEVGEALGGKCSCFEELKSMLHAEISGIEESIKGAGMVVIVAGLGGKTGTCLSGFIADLCLKKNIFTLFLPIYPLSSSKGFKDAETTVKSMKEKVGGIVIVDNNLKKEGGNIPMLQVFGRVNAIIRTFILSLISSISGNGPTNLGIDDLMHFFHGDVFFILTSGSYNDLLKSCKKAMDEISLYADQNEVRRILIIASTPGEVSIGSMRELNAMIGERYDSQGVRWVNSISRGGTMLLMVSAISDLPLVEGVEMPESIKGDREEYGSHVEPRAAVEKTQEVDNQDEEKQSDEEVGEAKASELEKSSVGVEENKKEEGISELKEEDEESGERELEECEQNLESVLCEDNDFDNHVSETMVAMSPKRPKSQALIGLDKAEEEVREESPEEPSVREEPWEDPEESEDDLDEVIGELTGFPVFKKDKKGQKRLGDYDDLGIGYI
jgi:cell division GTPase FtsZ